MEMELEIDDSLANLDISGISFNEEENYHIDGVNRSRSNDISCTQHGNTSLAETTAEDMSAQIGATTQFEDNNMSPSDSISLYNGSAGEFSSDGASVKSIQSNREDSMEQVIDSLDGYYIYEHSTMETNIDTSEYSLGNDSTVMELNASDVTQIKEIVEVKHRNSLNRIAAPLSVDEINASVAALQQFVVKLAGGWYLPPNHDPLSQNELMSFVDRLLSVLLKPAVLYAELKHAGYIHCTMDTFITPYLAPYISWIQMESLIIEHIDNVMNKSWAEIGKMKKKIVEIRLADLEMMNYYKYYRPNHRLTHQKFKWTVQRLKNKRSLNTLDELLQTILLKVASEELYGVHWPPHFSNAGYFCRFVAMRHEIATKLLQEVKSIAIKGVFNVARRKRIVILLLKARRIEKKVKMAIKDCQANDHQSCLMTLFQPNLFPNELLWL